MERIIKHVAIFNRKSRSEGDTDETLRNHRQITERLCNERGYTYERYEEIISGASKWEDRPELLRLLEEIDSGNFDAVVTVELSRLARSGRYSQEIADTLADNNVLIITPKETIDLNVNSQRLLYDIQSAVNSNEYRVIRSRMRTGTIEKAKRGEYVASKSPFGYDAVVINKKRTLIPNKDANIVQTIFNLAENGYGQKEIARMVGKPFKSVQNILYNQQYTGTLVFKLNDKKGNITEVIETPNAFEGIITKEQFNRVQSAIQSRLSGDNEVRNRSRGEVRTILKDLLYCRQCGAKIGFQYNPQRSLMVKKCRCGMRGVTESRLLESFQKKFRFFERKYREKWSEALEEANSIPKDSLVQTISELKKNADKLKKRLEGYIEMRADGDLTREQFQKKKVETETELKSINKQIDDLNSQLHSTNVEALNNQYEAKIELIKRINECYANENLVECNRLLKLIIDKVYYTRLTEKVTGITATGEGLKVEQGDFIQILIASKDIYD